MKINKRELGERIKELRLQKNMSMEDLAKNLKVAGRSTINTWEKGASIPNNKNLMKIANFFNVDINFIKYGTLKNYVLSLIKNELHVENSKLYSVVEEFLTFYDKNYVDFQDAAVFYDDSGKPISPEKYPSIIYQETTDEFMEIFSSKLYLKFNKTSENVLHYDNDQSIKKSIINFLINETIHYSETFTGKVNIIKKSINENLTLTMGFSNVSIKELEKNKNLTPSSAINLKYSSKLHDLEMNFIKKLNKIEIEYKNLMNSLNKDEN